MFMLLMVLIVIYMYFLISYQLIDLHLISFYHVLIVIIYDSFFIVSVICSTSLLSTLVVFFYGVRFILFLVLRGLSFLSKGI